MGDEIRQAFERLILRPHGIILITGPTGSGKSTTLYAALQRINTIDKHIITVEDPVEYYIAGGKPGRGGPGARRLLRRGVEEHRAARPGRHHGGVRFATGRPPNWRSKPRSPGTWCSPPCTPTRPRGRSRACWRWAASLTWSPAASSGVMAQRLVRRICVNCKRAYEPNAAERRILGIPQDRPGVQVYRGAGCSRCLRSGYYDRVGVFEFVGLESGLEELIMDKAPMEELAPLRHRSRRHHPPRRRNHQGAGGAHHRRRGPPRHRNGRVRSCRTKVPLLLSSALETLGVHCSENAWCATALEQ